jgi:hypothetical protein
MFKKASNSVCTSNVVSPDPLFPTPSTSPAMKNPENTEEDPDDPELAGDGDVKVKYPSDYMHSPNIGAVANNYL